jgi:S1-C subfamily serine protease
MALPASSPSGRESLVVALGRHSLTLALVACLLGLAAANISLRASWHEVEDGVLWRQGVDGIIAAEVAPFSAADKAGVRPGDLLLALDGVPAEGPEQILAALHGARRGERVSYTVLRGRTEQLL